MKHIQVEETGRVAIRPEQSLLPQRAAFEARMKPPPRPAEGPQPGGAMVAAATPGATVVRALPLPPAADDRFQPTRAIVVGMRESRALAALAADIVDRLTEAAGADADTLRIRLREVVEIGSARDTGGPLAGLYAAARRDAAAPLARVLADAGADPVGLRAALAEAAQELRSLDERFAARDFALSGPAIPALPKLAQPPSAAGLDLVV
jgi:hypothetical protein